MKVWLLLGRIDYYDDSVVLAAYDSAKKANDMLSFLVKGGLAPMDDRGGYTYYDGYYTQELEVQ